MVVRIRSTHSLSMIALDDAQLRALARESRTGYNYVVTSVLPVICEPASYVICIILVSTVLHRSGFPLFLIPRLSTLSICLYLKTSSYFALFSFFPSIRRHTRLVSDWSSDVCSSD